MKKSLSIILIFAIIFSSCENKNNYSALVEQERKDIQKYIKDKGIKVYNYSKSDSVFVDGKTIDNICKYVTDTNVYYSLGTDSIYIRINIVGDTIQKPVKLNDKVQVRYIETTLDGLYTESYWTTLDLPYPPVLIFGNIPSALSGAPDNTNCAGWQTAIRLMKYSEAEAEIIVPSKLGILKNYTTITPCHYKFYFKIFPK